MNPLRRNIALVFVLLAFVGGSLLFFRAFSGGNAAPLHATVLPQPVQLPDFTLIDEDGRSFTKASFRGQWSLLFFGFTHCPDICPATLQQLAIARSQSIEQDLEFPQIILVSVDPERDTPEVLAAYVRNFGTDMKGLTGTDEQLRRLTKPLGIYFEKSAQTSDNYSVDHSAAVLLIDQDGLWRALFSAPHSVDEFVNDVPLLTGAD